MDSHIIETPVGLLRIEMKDKKVVRCYWVDDEEDIYWFSKKRENKNLSREWKEIDREFREYFKGDLHNFTIPVETSGSEFEQKVWNEIRKIEYGETVSYGEIARKIGESKAVRAVGIACKRNPIGIIIPCHRVTGKSGIPIGYNGGIDRKLYLLDLESSASGLFGLTE